MVKKVIKIKNFRLDDTAHQGEIGDDQYDNDEFYRDQQPKNSDIRIEEEEDEAGGKKIK